MWKAIDRRLSKWQYSWMARSAVRPAFSRQPSLQEDLQARGFYSQCGQDRWLVEELLPNKRHGVFVDVGAHDGQSFSNTLYLERELGWTGLAVEPLPEPFAKLQATRSCSSVQACVAAAPGSATFRAVAGYGEMLSGLADTCDPRHKQRIQREISDHGGTIHEIEVACFTLGQLLDRHQLTRVDYLDLDVEGAELSILETFDFERYSVAVIAVENNYGDPRIPELMAKNGFQFHSVVGDDFYLNRRLASATTHSEMEGDGEMEGDRL